MKALTNTDFHFEGQKSVYHGKVRDVYNIGDDLIVMVATDRISAFDVVLPKGIPFKGQVLNQIAAKFLDHTNDICPNWKLATPDPQVTVGLKCEGFRVEMIIRSILTGSAWREYQKGCRELCGVKLPDGMKENQRFPPSTFTNSVSHLTFIPTGVGATCSTFRLIPTVPIPSSSSWATLFHAVSSMSAIIEGVAKTSNVPLAILRAVISLVTTFSNVNLIPDSILI